MNHKIQQATRYIEELGWALVPIPPGTKGPVNKGWNLPSNTIRTSEKANEFYSNAPDWNMGVLLNTSNIVILDIDNVEYTQMLFNTFGIDYDTIMENAPRIIGRAGRDKAIFKAPLGIDLSRRSISWPDPHDTTKRITVIEFRANDIQDVLPPSIHPDTKKPYEWRVDPFNGIPELPDQILTIWQNWDTFKQQLHGACPWATITPEYTAPPKKPRVVSSDFVNVIDEFNAAHSVESIIEKHGYKRTRGGRYLSPFSESKIAGVHVFEADNRIFSHHASDPFDTTHSHDAFDMFCFFEHGNDVKRAVREAANILGIKPEQKFNDDESLQHGKSIIDGWNKKQAAPKTTDKNIPPNELLQIPGVLQDVVDYYNSTAAKAQPQFAVQCALAYGATVMGRRFRTNWHNYPSLYFINVGKSGCGKEHSKTVIEHFLESSKLERLIGSNGYTSGSGVLSALIAQPSHISIIDELGRQIESSSKSSNSHKMDSHTMIMEIFGRLAGTVRSQAYSTMTMSKPQDMNDKYVRNPALTLLTMTTPSTLYENLSSRYVTDGFLGRFIIVESYLGRQVGGVFRKLEPSKRVLDWSFECANASASSGNLSDVESHLIAPDPMIIPFDEECETLLNEFDAKVINWMDSINNGLDELFTRTKEIAQRVALIVAVSDGSKIVRKKHLEWAINYVWHYAIRNYEAIKTNVSDSDFESVCQKVLEVLKKAGEQGRTDRELSNYCRAYKGLIPQKRKEVMDALSSDYFVKKVQTGQRMAWVFFQE